MESDNNAEPLSLSTQIAQEEHQVREQKRFLYQMGLSICALIVALSWFLRRPNDHFIDYVYPAFILVLVVVFVLLRQRKVALERLENLIFALVAGLVLTRLGWHFHFAGSIDDQLLILVGGHYWAVGSLIVAGTIMLEGSRGLRAGIAILVMTTVIALSGVAKGLLVVGVELETLGYLLRVHLFLLVLLMLAIVAMIIRDHHRRVLIRAEVLDQWAYTDTLTGLFNRRAIDAFLAREIAEAKRYVRPLSIILIDIDHFKKVNDTHGHLVGDKVLMKIARRLSSQMRRSNFLARWGGEEFLIVAPETRAHEAIHFAKRCQAAVASAPFDGISVTATFSVSELRADDSIETLLERADVHLYRGKDAGRNRVVADISQIEEQ